MLQTLTCYIFKSVKSESLVVHPYGIKKRIISKVLQLDSGLGIRDQKHFDRTFMCENIENLL